MTPSRNKDKEQEREEINRKVEEYKNKGKTIEEVPKGTSGSDGKSAKEKLKSL
jgi:hypothetical protein